MWRIENNNAILYMRYASMTKLFIYEQNHTFEQDTENRFRDILLYIYTTIACVCIGRRRHLADFAAILKKILFFLCTIFFFSSLKFISILNCYTRRHKHIYTINLPHLHIELLYAADLIAIARACDHT